MIAAVLVRRRRRRAWPWYLCRTLRATIRTEVFRAVRFYHRASPSALRSREIAFTLFPRGPTCLGRRSAGIEIARRSCCGDAHSISATPVITAAPSGFRLPDAHQTRAVHLQVGDRGSSHSISRSSGCVSSRGGGGSATARARRPRLIIELVERPGEAKARGVSGLYHFAILCRSSVARPIVVTPT